MDLRAVAAETVRRLTPLATAGGVRLILDSTDQLRVEVDPDRVEQILTILIDNALKHTPSGGQVTLTARRHGGDALLTVQDTGEGIAPEDLDRIFDRFYRADRARSRDGGAGLGLATAKALVEAHGGRLVMESQQGRGTTATVVLKLMSTPSLAARATHLAGRQSHQPARE